MANRIIGRTLCVAPLAAGFCCLTLAGRPDAALPSAARPAGCFEAVSPDPAARASGAYAYLVVDVASGRTLASARPDILGSPVLPGSILKIATLLAALESRVIEPGTSLPCRRDVTVDGHRLICVHPSLGRPLTPAEALAYSCNDYLTTIAARLPRSAFDRALAQLGLPPTPASVPLAAAAIGLEGSRVTPERLLHGFVRLVRRPSPVAIRDPTRRVLTDGLRGCASYGTASALAASGIQALAKTGTAPMPGGGTEGLVVAAAPAEAPSRAVLIVAPGASGSDAAALAARWLQPQAGEAAQDGFALRVGSAKAGGGYEVSEIPLEDYVARVVAAEQAPNSPAASLEALAITVRTFALANRGRHRAEGFDLCDLTHCQVVGRATAASTAASARTNGLILRDQRGPAQVFYTGSCGGHSERPSNVWPGSVDATFLPSRPDPWCEGLPRWTSEIPAEDLERAIRAAGLRGDRLLDLTVTVRTPSRRAARVGVAGFVPGEVPGETLRLAVGRTLGWNLLKSAAFEVVRTARGYRFSGTGLGHGVGLCVTGSAKMAAQGRSAAQILDAYFPGLTVGRADEAAGRPQADTRNLTRVSVSLPAAEEGERSHVVALAGRAMADISRKTGAAPASEVLLEFHPTVESYQRATGQPWWTAAAARDQRIVLLPASVLRQRGILDRTIRHEIAHVLTAPYLRGRPLWVVEGAALFFSSETSPAAGHTTCPTDDELARSRSAEALRDAHTRAGACFARAIASGVAWQAVR